MGRTRKEEADFETLYPEWVIPHRRTGLRKVWKVQRGSEEFVLYYLGYGKVLEKKE